MNDLDLTLLSKDELLKLIKEKNNSIFSLAAEGYEKDVQIQSLRIYIEELDRKRLLYFNRMLELRNSLNEYKDLHAQETHFLQEEITARDEQLKELEEQLEMLTRRASI